MSLDKYYLNLAGEYRVAAELLKREIFATITYGNKKGVVCPSTVDVPVLERCSLAEPGAA